MTRSGPAVSLRLVAVVVVVSSLLLGAGWITASIRDQGAREAIESLRATQPGLAELVELRFFAGLSNEEAARALGLSERTVYRDWTYAKALLLRALRG